MKVTKNFQDLSLKVTMTRKEMEDGILLSISRNSGRLFQPYKIVEIDSAVEIPDEFSVKLEYVPKGGS